MFKVIFIHLEKLGILIIEILYILGYNEKEKNQCLQFIIAGLSIFIWFYGFGFREFEMPDKDKEFKYEMICSIF